MSPNVAASQMFFPFQGNMLFSSQIAAPSSSFGVNSCMDDFEPLQLNDINSSSSSSNNYSRGGPHTIFMTPPDYDVADLEPRPINEMATSSRPTQALSNVNIAVGASPLSFPSLVRLPFPMACYATAHYPQRVTTAISTSSLSLPKPAATGVGILLPSSNTNKRKRSSDYSSSNGGVNDKKCTRRERNREHAKKSRLRKKTVTESLEQSLTNLKEENETLRNFVYTQLVGSSVSSKEQADIMIQKQIDETVSPIREATENRRFVEGMKKPENHILDETTQVLLKKLSKNMSFPQCLPFVAIG